MPRFRTWFVLFALLLPAMALAQAKPAPAAAAPTAGVDYEVIEGGVPFAPHDGKIEVVEIFGYWCHHCADFQPRIAAWKGRLPKDVRFAYLPLPARSDDPFALGFFASQAAGTLDRTHDAIYRAVHDEHALPKNPTADELLAFHAQQGLDAERLRTLMASPAVAAKLKPAREFAVRSGLQGTPTLVINGRYRIDAGTHEQRLRTADYLIALERAAAKRRR